MPERPFQNRAVTIAEQKGVFRMKSAMPPRLRHLRHKQTRKKSREGEISGGALQEARSRQDGVFFRTTHLYQRPAFMAEVRSSSRRTEAEQVHARRRINAQNDTAFYSSDQARSYRARAGV